MLTGATTCCSSSWLAMMIKHWVVFQWGLGLGWKRGVFIAFLTNYTPQGLNRFILTADRCQTSEKAVDMHHTSRCGTGDRCQVSTATTDRCQTYKGDIDRLSMSISDRCKVSYWQVIGGFNRGVFYYKMIIVLCWIFLRKSTTPLIKVSVGISSDSGLLIITL